MMEKLINPCAQILIDDMLPPWAIGKTDGVLVLGAQLPTRDGRRMGNSHIINISQDEYINIDFGMLYTILTDAGNEFKLFKIEMDSAFYPPQWVSDVSEIKRKFGARD
jgi:hypothetical protein